MWTSLYFLSIPNSTANTNIIEFDIHPGTVAFKQTAYCVFQHLICAMLQYGRSYCDCWTRDNNQYCWSWHIASSAFINIFVFFPILLRFESILLVEETGENHQPVESQWQTLSHNVVSSTPSWPWFEHTTLVVIGTDCTGSCKSNYHMINDHDVPLPELDTTVSVSLSIDIFSQKWLDGIQKFVFHFLHAYLYIRAYLGGIQLLVFHFLHV